MAKTTARNQMKEGAKLLEDLFTEHLSLIADNLIQQVMAAYRSLIPSESLKAINDLQPKGVQAYRAELLDAMAALSLDGLNQVRKEVPAAKKVKLDDIDKLTPALQKKLRARLDLLVGKQIGDLLSVIKFAYAQNEDTTDSENQIEQDLRDSAIGWLDGTTLSAGAEITAATVINDARNEFFDSEEVLDEIDAFEFVNGDPVSDICKDLAGTIFSKDDPNAFRYTPPLHWNCKSYIRPILKGNLGNRETEELKPSTKKLEQSIQFHDHDLCQEHGMQRMLDET